MNSAVIRATGGLPRAAAWRVLGLIAVAVVFFAFVAIVPLGDARGGFSVFVGTEGNRILIKSVLITAPVIIFVCVLHLLAGAGRIPLVILRRRGDSASLRFRLARGGLLPRTMPLDGSVTLSLGYDPAKPGWDVVGASKRGRVVRMSTLGIVEKAELEAMAEAIRATGVSARVVVKEPGRPTAKSA